MGTANHAVPFLFLLAEDLFLEREHLHYNINNNSLVGYRIREVADGI